VYKDAEPSRWPGRRLFALFDFGSKVVVALTGIEPVFQP
jgi:hypothetical protein